MPLFILALLLFTSTNIFAWDLKDFSQEVAVPVSTDAKKILIYGSLATIGLLIFEDQIVDPVQEKATKDKPLGKWSKAGDLIGLGIPNAIYVIGQALSGDTEKSQGMLKASLYTLSVTTALKYTVREPRPDDKNERNSFPSGHSSMAFAFGGYIYEEHGWKWGVPALGLSIFSGLSRINDNRHYLHDVVAGATIGLAYGVGMSKYQKDMNATGMMIVPIFDSKNKGIALHKDF